MNKQLTPQLRREFYNVCLKMAHRPFPEIAEIIKGRCKVVLDRAAYDAILENKGA